MPVVPTPAYRQTSPSKPAPAISRRQPPKAAPPSRSERERERVKKTAEFCADSIASGWQETVAGQVMKYAQSAWIRLSRSRRRRRNCKALASIARLILEAKTQIDKGVGKLFGWAVGRLGAGDAASAWLTSWQRNIPLPFDAKMIAVARGVQVAGILLCVMDDRDLTECECFIDLALAETQERVKQILVAAMSDWTGLARFQPNATKAVR